MLRSLFVIMVLLALPAAPLFAQEGPYVPCVGCDELTWAPYPEAGLWYNPDQSGSGFTFEFQKGVMAGYYYGYDAEGQPEWYLVSGTLLESETPGVMWELEVEPQRFTGGNCLGCPYQAPNDPEALSAIRIEFLQRAYARITLSDDSIQYMVPIIYGDGGKQFFAEQTPYLFPMVAPSPWLSVWSLMIKEPTEDEYAPWAWTSGIYIINQGRINTGGQFEGKLIYPVYAPLHPPEGSIGVSEIVCDLEEPEGEPVCELPWHGGEPFRIPIGNFTDNRFFGEAEDGRIVQGFRLQYD